ncbi:MAG TPA: hypothetical protein VF676_11115 [Flavobacterium sp.]|jgi:hypothetical protein
MSNIVIASNDALCQSAKNWFVQNNIAVEGPALDKLGDGDKLYIIAHDTELGSGEDFSRYVLSSTTNFPMTNWVCVLIVCSAAALPQGKILSAAENVANFFKRPVMASTTTVYGQWSATGATFTGEYRTVNPGEDVESLFENLTIK